MPPLTPVAECLPLLRDAIASYLGLEVDRWSLCRHQRELWFLVDGAEDLLGDTVIDFSSFARFDRETQNDLESRGGKVQADCRDVPMTTKLLEALRAYWRWKRPKDYLFPSTEGHRGVEQPISDHTT